MAVEKENYEIVKLLMTNDKININIFDVFKKKSNNAIQNI